MRTRSPLLKTCSGSVRTAKPFESRMNNVIPRPIRRALTGVAGSDGGAGFLPEFSGLTGVLSGDLFGVLEPDFGRRRLGLEATPEVVVFSFGPPSRNTPRTAPSSLP